MPTRMVEFPGDENAAVDSEVVPSSLAFIAPILRVANEIQKENERVAYLCTLLLLLSPLSLFVFLSSFSALLSDFVLFYFYF